MYLHLSNIQSCILIFIFDLLFANLIGSRKHKFKGLNRGKRRNTKNIEIRQEHWTTIGAKKRAEEGYLSITNRKKTIKRLQFAKLWLLKNICVSFESLYF